MMSTNSSKQPKSANFRPISRFGVEISGIDINENTVDQMAGWITDLLYKHQLLVIRGQPISPMTQRRLTALFGKTVQSFLARPASHKVLGYKDILQLSNENESPTIRYGMAWHSDGLAYAKVPHGVTILHCVRCSGDKGDTLFASQYLAYNMMPLSFRSQIAKLQWHLPKREHSEVPEGKGLVHPMIRCHSKTQKYFTFCSPSAEQIRGLDAVASKSILKDLEFYQTNLDVIYRHNWQANDTVIWENCTLLHNRADIADFHRDGLRLMHRSAAIGNYEAIECEESTE